MKTIGAGVAMVIALQFCGTASEAWAADCASALRALEAKRVVESARALIRNRCVLPERFAPYWTMLDNAALCSGPWRALADAKAQAHIGDLIEGRCEAELHALGKSRQVPLPACCMTRSCHAVANDALDGHGYVSTRHGWPLPARIDLVSRLRDGGYCADPEVQGRTAPACSTLPSIVGGRGHRAKSIVDRLKRAGACSPRPCCVPPVATAHPPRVLLTAKRSM